MSGSPKNSTDIIDQLYAQSFGDALRFLRKRAQLTQDELGRAVGYSREQIARLENGSRLPDLAVVAALFIPALDAQRRPELAQRLLELAGQTRADTTGTQRVTVTRTVQTRTQRALEIVSQSTSIYPLPVPSHPLIGRTHELDGICDLLLGDARLVTLIGAPGIGKTRLALETAHILKTRFAEGACFIALDSIQRAEDVPGAVANALGVTPTTDQPVKAVISAHLAARELLLVLDNCEHILEVGLLFGEWLSAAPKLKLLCTSRVALDLYGEYEWDLSPLALPDLSHLPAPDELRHIASVQLFVARARAAHASFDLDHENALSVATLCVALDGLPLALEIAAARTREIAPPELLQQLILTRRHSQLSSTLLQQTKRNIAERHRTLHAAISWSYHLLPTEQQNVFIRLGILAGGCSFETAQVICGANRGVLEALASTSLLRIESGRVVMLETLRAFALEELVSANLFFSLQQMHAEYFAEYAQVVFKEILGENSAHWLAKTHLDHDNFRAALRFALEQNNGDLAVSLAGGLWWFWSRQGFVREAMTWLEASLHCAMPEPFDDEKKRRRANALNGAGSTATELNDFDAAMVYHQEGLQLRQELQDKKGISTVLHNMGLVAQCQGDYPRAIQWMEESLGLVEPADKRGLAMSYANLGVVTLLMNDLSNSQNWLERALEIVKATEYPWETAFAANCLATVFFEQGNFERAEEMGLKSMALFKEMGDLLYIPEPQLLLAKLSHLRGDLAKAQALSLEALNQYQEMEDQHGVANALHVLAWIALAENPTLAGANRAASLFNESKALRNTVKRNLSPLEQSENQRLLAAIEQYRSSKS